MTNDDLVSDWLAYRAGHLEVDQSHFLTLFHEDHDPETLNLIFAGLPNSDELASRVMRCRRARRRRLTGEPTLTAERALATARADLDVKLAIVLKAEDEELEAIIKRAEPKLCNDPEQFKEARFGDWPHCTLHEVIGDHADTLWHDIGRVRYALGEAFYGIASDYEGALYVEEPLMRTQLSFEPPMLLWEAGYEAALTEDAYLLHRASRAA